MCLFHKVLNQPQLAAALCLLPLLENEEDNLKVMTNNNKTESGLIVGVNFMEGSMERKRKRKRVSPRADDYLSVDGQFGVGVKSPGSAENRL